MQERFDYLARYRRPLPEEDFEVAMKAYEWPKKFVSIMKEAATKATSGTTASQGLCVLQTLMCVQRLSTNQHTSASPLPHFLLF